MKHQQNSVPKDPLDTLNTHRPSPACCRTSLTKMLFRYAQHTRSQAGADTVFAQALAAGATAVKPPQTTFRGGYAGYFADPDGHL